MGVKQDEGLRKMKEREKNKDQSRGLAYWSTIILHDQQMVMWLEAKG